MRKLLSSEMCSLLQPVEVFAEEIDGRRVDPS